MIVNFYSGVKMAQVRTRDPIPNMPLFEHPPPAKGESARVRQRRGCQIAARRRANQDIIVLQQMTSGTFNEKLLDEEPWPEPSHPRPRSEVAKDLAQAILAVEERLARPSDCPTGDDAVRRLLGSAYRASGKESVRLTRGTVPLRGEVWPMNVPDVDLPPPFSLPVCISELSRKIHRAFANAEKIMYKEDFLSTAQTVHWMMEVATPGGAQKASRSETAPEKVRAFEDPVLRDPRQRLALAVRLWQAGMLRTVNRARGFVSLFTVVKKQLPCGAVALRLVFDLRELNKLFKTPPWAALGGPSPVSGIEVCAESAAGWTLRGASGDIPDFFYRLGIPASLSEAFCFPAVTPAALSAELTRVGWTGPMPDLSARYLAFCIAPMGWSWAVWAAQETINAVCGPAVKEFEAGARKDEPSPLRTEKPGTGADQSSQDGERPKEPRRSSVIAPGQRAGEVGQQCVFEEEQSEGSSDSESDDDYEPGLPVLDKSRLLVHGAPIPRFGLRRRRRAVYSLYVDDFIILVLENILFPETVGDAVKLRNLMKQALIAAGFAVHKEADGDALAVTGVIVGGSPLEAAPMEWKRWLVREATEELCLRRTKVVRGWIESIVGSLAWFMLLGRGGFSIFDRVYKFIREGGQKDVVEIPSTTKCELVAAARLSGLFRIRLDSGYWHKVYMLDASPVGAGIISTEATLRECRSEARYGHRSAWTTWTESDIELGLQEIRDQGQLVEFVDGLGVAKEKFARILILGGGPRQAAIIEREVRPLMRETGIMVDFEVMDKNVFPGGSLTNEADRSRLLLRAKQGAFDYVYTVFGGETWGQPRSTVLRTPCYKWGLSIVSEHSRRRIKQANVRILASTVAAAAVEDTGGDWTFVTDGKVGHPAVHISHLEEICELTHGAEKVRQGCICQWGAPICGGRWVASSHVKDYDFDGKCSGNSSERLSVGESHGVAVAGEPDLIAKHARLIAERLVERRSQLKGAPDPDDFDDKDCMLSAGTRIRAPPVGKAFDDSARFKEEFRIRWAKPEPSNVVETVAIASCLRHVVRDKRSWGKRIIIVSDNLAAIGVTMKGRSSKRRMLMLTRQIGALALAAGLKIHVRWTPSERNWSDGPSRGHKIGYYHAGSRKVITKFERRLA